MVGSIDRIKELTQRIDEKIALSKSTTKDKETTPQALNDKSPKDQIKTIRHANINRVNELYIKLSIYEKSPDFGEIFLYKA
ncbi:MAG: hypothetical protein U9N49_09205, partial [Campylobacterota bacterium]|nr:hypothetical protein [Campylobacterota bacterium]